jgi:hypothetical protein
MVGNFLATSSVYSYTTHTGQKEAKNQIGRGLSMSAWVTEVQCTGRYEDTSTDAAAHCEVRVHGYELARIATRIRV